MTQWRPVEGFEHYEVSDDGQVRVLGRPGRGRLNETRILKLGTTGTGYAQVLLYPGAKARRVHRLVLEAFVGPPPPGAFGLHNDDDPMNNHLSNLRWGTPSTNALDMVANGRHNHARMTECVHGHPFSGENLKKTRRQRVCRACARRRNAEYYARRQGRAA